MKNFKEIVEHFDTIDDVIIQPNGTSIRVRGTKHNDFADAYIDYTHKEVAQEVAKKVSYFIGI